MIGSDGSEGTAHPRGSGTFARVLSEMVRKRKLLSLEEAVHRMTGLPAEAIGLDKLGRGRIQSGMAADLCVFDPERVVDTATFDRPNRLAEGFEWVAVNGELVRDGATFRSVRAGRVLLKNAG